MHVGERGLQSDSKFSQVGKQKQPCDSHGCPSVSDGAVCKEAHSQGWTVSALVTSISVKRPLPRQNIKEALN